MKRPEQHVRNVFSLPKELTTAHGGQGKIEFCRPFQIHELDSALAFVDYVELQPGTSIGLHRHAEDEEIYFLIAGSGVMTLNGESFDVKAGDLIRNPPGGEHSFLACGDSVSRILVFDVAQDRASRSEHA